MKRHSLAVVLAFLCAAAHAATPATPTIAPAVTATGTATLTMTGPTQNTDGSALLGPATCNVFSGLKGQAKTLLVTGIPCTTFVVSGLTIGTTVCFQVTATVAGESADSDLSTEGCKSFPKPNAPGLTIAKNVFQKHGADLWLVGQTTIGVQCGQDCHCKNFAGRELYYIPRSRVTFAAGRDNGTQTLGVCA